MDLSLPLISVIIPTRNRVQRLKRGLDRLLEDDYPRKEIIVCDGASTDGTLDLLRSYGNQVLWVSEPDCGEFDARNKGLRMASGQIIRYMSDDDVPVPGGLAYSARYLTVNPEVDILFGQAVICYEQADGRKIPIDTRMRTTESVQLRNWIRAYMPYPPSETAFFRRRVIDRIGYFDTVRGADHEYWARAAKAGLGLDICDQVFLHYYRSFVNETRFADIYTELVFSCWTLACRYGTWEDRLYVAAIRIPYLLLLNTVRRYLPPQLTLPLRRARWQWMNRKSAL